MVANGGNWKPGRPPHRGRPASPQSERMKGRGLGPACPARRSNACLAPLKSFRSGRAAALPPGAPHTHLAGAPTGSAASPGAWGQGPGALPGPSSCPSKGRRTLSHTPRRFKPVHTRGPRPAALRPAAACWRPARAQRRRRAASLAPRAFACTIKGGCARLWGALHTKPHSAQITSDAAGAQARLARPGWRQRKKSGGRRGGRPPGPARGRAKAGARCRRPRQSSPCKGAAPSHTDPHTHKNIPRGPGSSRPPAGPGPRGHQCTHTDTLGAAIQFVYNQLLTCLV
jgi:hypothetical protein